MPAFRSLRARLSAGLVGIALAVAALVAIGNVALLRLGGAIGTILTENYVSVVACEAMNESVDRAVRSVARGERPDADERRRFEEAFARERANVTEPGEAELVAAVAVEIEPFWAAIAARDEHAIDERFAALKRPIHAIAVMNQRAMERSDGAARALARRSTEIASVVSVVTLLLAAWLAFALPRAWIAPVDHFRQAAAQIGEGNFDAVIPEPEATELAPLARAMHGMQAKLRAYRESSLGELLAAKDLAHATVTSFDDPVLVLAGTKVVLANQAAEAVLDLGEGDDARDGAIGAAIAQTAEAALDDRAARPTSLADACAVRVNGSDRFYLLRGTPLRAEPGEPPRALVVAQDVTRLRKVDEMKSSVVAVVSHELKTPLTSLRMATHLLLEPNNGPLTEAQLELVTTAKDDTERLRALVDGFLDLTRIEAEAGALRHEDTDVAKLVAEVLAAHRTVADARGVHLTIDAPPVVASLDRGKVSIAIANLVANAVRHTSAGGTVSIGCARDGDGVRITVTDTGEGIPAAEIAHVFERFHRGKGELAGELRLGLGLAITREIVEQHGGNVDVASPPGEGARFSIWLPRSP